MSFAKTLEETGDKEQAGIQYRAAIELKPELEKSQEELEAFEERVEPDDRGPVLRALKSLFNRP
ncbi:MAG: hypothetical protein VYE73_01150 [Acidobacteriota bacterium]|nr:hypothetical protein [Acidobacteriota bacterium]